MLARMMHNAAPITRLQDQMNRLFESFFDDAPTSRGYSAGYPSLNFWQDGDTAYVEAELPGMSMDEIEVLVAGNQLTIGGERKIAQADNARSHRRERASGRFSRTLALPWDIDVEKVQAKLSDGVLTVALPKCEWCKPKKVNILPANT